MWEKYLTRRIRDYTNGLMKRTFNVNQPKNPDFIRFTNPQMTEGINSDGDIVKIGSIEGQPLEGGVGYLLDPTSKTYHVVGPKVTTQVMDGSPEKPYILLQGKAGTYASYRIIKVEKSTDATLYSVNVTMPDTGVPIIFFAPVTTRFSTSGKNLSLTAASQSNAGSAATATFNVSWQTILGFGLSGSTVTGTANQGQYSTAWSSFPTPPTPDPSSGGAGWTPSGSPSITTNYSTPTSEQAPRSNIDNNGSIDLIGFFVSTVRITQLFVNGLSSTTIDLTNTYRGRFQVIDVNGTPVFSGIVDNSIIQGIPTWNAGGPIIPSPTTSGIQLNVAVLYLYRNSDGTKAAAYRHNTFPTIHYWDQTGYINPLGTPIIGTAPILITNDVFLTDGSPFDSTSLIKATDTYGKYLTVVPTTHLTRYVLNNDNVTYTSKQFSIAPIATGTYNVRDWILTNS